jgi:predicted transposase YbfD/YdcC
MLIFGLELHKIITRSIMNLEKQKKRVIIYKMNKRYLKTLLKYISNVYDLGKKINSLKDNRKNARIPTNVIAFTLLIGFMISVRSFNKLDDYLENKNFRKLIPKKTKLPRIGAIRDSLKTFEVDGLIRIHDEILKKSKKNKLYRNGTIDGLKVAALDGVELFESTKKSCPNCLTRMIKKVPHYYHKSVVAGYVGTDPHLVLGQEMLKPKHDSSSYKGEGELTAAKRLIKALRQKHHNFADVIVYDAIACNSPWINFIKEYNMEAVVRVKDDRLNIVKDALGLFKGREADSVWNVPPKNNKMTQVSAWSENIDMSGVEDGIRFVKFIEDVVDLRTGEIVKTSEIWIITTAKNMSLETLRKIIHARWGIENNIFRQLKNQWHMDHCFIHHENGLEATLMFMIIAFNLMQLFFFKRLKNFRRRKLLQIEVIEKIILEMVVCGSEGKYIIDSS